MKESRGSVLLVEGLGIGGITVPMLSDVKPPRQGSPMEITA